MRLGDSMPDPTRLSRLQRSENPALPGNWILNIWGFLPIFKTFVKVYKRLAILLALQIFRRQMNVYPAVAWKIDSLLLRPQEKTCCHWLMLDTGYWMVDVCRRHRICHAGYLASSIQDPASALWWRLLRVNLQFWFNRIYATLGFREKWKDSWFRYSFGRAGTVAMESANQHVSLLALYIYWLHYWGLLWP